MSREIKFRAYHKKENKMFGVLRLGLNPTPYYVTLVHRSPRPEWERGVS